MVIQQPTVGLWIIPLSVSIQNNLAFRSCWSVCFTVLSTLLERAIEDLTVFRKMMSAGTVEIPAYLSEACSLFVELI